VNRGTLYRIERSRQTATATLERKLRAVIGLKSV
jgi:hypothetical protein